MEFNQKKKRVMNIYSKLFDARRHKSDQTYLCLIDNKLDKRL